MAFPLNSHMHLLPRSDFGLEPQYRLASVRFLGGTLLCGEENEAVSLKFYTSYFKATCAQDKSLQFLQVSLDCYLTKRGLCGLLLNVWSFQLIIFIKIFLLLFNLHCGLCSHSCVGTRQYYNVNTSVTEININLIDLSFSIYF